MSQPPESAYRPAARATPTLVGRAHILARIRDIIERRADPVVVYIRGDGGIGKTLLATEVLRLCREGHWKSHTKPLLAAGESVDLYHTQTHTLEGLVRALGAVIGIEVRERFFRSYEAALNTLDDRKPDLGYALREITDLRDRMTRAFLDSFQQMAEAHRVVIAFDTAEMLQYETDAVQEALQLGPEGIGARDWLIHQLLRGVPNTVFLIAGRPRPQLLDDLRAALGNRLEVIELDTFTPEESEEYFNQVIDAFRVSGEQDIAQRIESIDLESREMIHLLSGGRPIMLSLTIDLLALAQRLPDELKMPLVEAKALWKDETRLKAARLKLESDIVGQFPQTGRPADEAILSLAFARKGMDPTLLARVADMELDEARRILSALTGLRFDTRTQWPERAGHVHSLSFIKVRPADHRIFLHDEMYDMMERHILNTLPDAAVARAYRAILDYYADELDKNREQIDKLQPSFRGEADESLRAITVARPQTTSEQRRELAKAETYRGYLRTEQIHYLLRYKPVEGFRTYSRYADDAHEANDIDSELQMRDELLAFVNSPKRREQSTFDGLRRVEVDLDAGIRWIKRNYQRRSYDKAILIATRLRLEYPELIDQIGEVGKARLDAWEALSSAYGGDFDRAERLLQKAIKTLSDTQPESELGQQQRALEIANAYNGLGYLSVQIGRHRYAIDTYRRALRLWRKLGKGYESQHANTLNNLSWALAELGDFDDALQYCQDGLRLRLGLGARYPIALSYNTLGHIATRNGQPDHAQNYCERALLIFRELDMPRGIGVASIALAEAYRCMGAIDTVYFPNEQVKQLRQAVQYALEAVAIFGPYEKWPDTRREAPLVAESSRLVDALIELGCAYRDWLQLWESFERQPGDPSRETLSRMGEKALREAVEVAGSQQTRRSIDALVNLTWLKYYVNDLAGIETIMRDVLGMIKPEHLISRVPGMPSAEPDQPWQWAQLGKLHMLKGQIAFDRFERLWDTYKGTTQANQEVQQVNLALQEAAEAFTLALAYDDLYSHGHVFRDLKADEARIYDRLKGLNVADLLIVQDAMRSTAGQYHLKEPRLSKLLSIWFGTDIGEEEMI